MNKAVGIYHIIQEYLDFFFFLYLPLTYQQHEEQPVKNNRASQFNTGSEPEKDYQF